MTAAVALAAAGDLDPSFGTAGKVTNDFSTSNDEALAVTPQNGGKVVAAGLTGSDFGLARYNKDGSVDGSFGSNGTVDTSFGVPQAQALDVRKLPSNDLIAVGTDGTNFALARYQSDGTLDTSFDGDGKVTTSFSPGTAAAFSVIRQPDNKLVAGGSGNGDFALARYKKDGSLDSSFGTGGKVVTTIGPFQDQISALLLQPDGKLVAVGTTEDSTGNNPDFALARYNTDGTLDSNFGTSGIVTTDIGTGTNDHGLDAVLQGDGKIVVAGESSPDVALARYNPDGSLDTSFDGDGKVTTHLGASLEESRAKAVGLDAAGNIVAAGTLFDSPQQFFVLRYTPVGGLDPTFGSGGEAFASFGAGFTEGEALDIEPNGKLVVAGHHGAVLGAQDFALARFLAS